MDRQVVVEAPFHVIIHRLARALSLSGAAEVVVVIITVGKGLDDEVIGCMEEDQFEPLEALFLETAGWLGIESATRSFVSHLSELVEPEGLRPTQRMGPGYSYKVDGGLEMWSLEDQRQIFEVFVRSWTAMAQFFKIKYGFCTEFWCGAIGRHSLTPRGH